MKKKIIIIVFITIASLVLTGIFSPVIQSYITGVPVHFRLIDANSDRNDIVKMYGEKIGKTPKGLELYKAKFLGIEGYINVDYFEDSDQVFLIQFSLRSGDYTQYEDFEKDVEKTYRYFSRVLRNMPTMESVFEDGRGGWKDLNAHMAYNVYNVNTVYDETGSHYIPDETITVFQFNTWTDDMEKDFT
jgi:hypothetical protein